MARTCKLCAKRSYGEYCFAHKPRKPIKKIGKRTIEYEIWKENVAKPYLERKGHKCAECGATGKLDIDHIQNRGSQPELKMNLLNIQYMCRSCHIRKTNRE